MIENLMVAGAAAEMARREAADSADVDTHFGLYMDVIAAISTGNVASPVHCPGWDAKDDGTAWNVGDVLADYLGSADAYPELLRMVCACRASNDQQARMAAKQFVEQIASAHANFHLGGAL